MSVKRTVIQFLENIEKLRRVQFPVSRSLLLQKTQKCSSVQINMKASAEY